MAMSGYPFYSVFNKVGHGATNGTADVMLVQYMIFNLIAPGRSSHWVSPMQAGLPAGIPHTEVKDLMGAVFPYDGKWRPQLKTWIQYFQKEASSQLGYNLTQDGSIHPFPAFWADKQGHTSSFTIQAMNEALHRANRTLFWQLWTAPDLPGPLKDDLNIVKLAHFKFGRP